MSDRKDIKQKLVMIDTPLPIEDLELMNSTTFAVIGAAKDLDTELLDKVNDILKVLKSKGYKYNYANDSKDDGNLDANDIKSLYLSDISGAKFTKVSVDLHEIIDWKIIEAQARIYFKAIEDTDKNGKFDKSDKIHYNFVNLLDADWKPIEYNPL